MPLCFLPSLHGGPQKLYLDESGTLGYSGEVFTMAIVLVRDLPGLETSVAKHRVTQTESKASQMKTAQKLALARTLIEENGLEIFLADLDPRAAMASERKLDKDMLYDSMAGQALAYYLQRGDLQRGLAYRLSMDIRGSLRESYEDLVRGSIGNVLMHRDEPLVTDIDVRFLDSKFSAGVQAADLFSNVYRTALSVKDSPCQGFLRKYVDAGIVHAGFTFGLPQLADQMTQIASDLRALVELEAGTPHVTFFNEAEAPALGNSESADTSAETSGRGGHSRRGGRGRGGSRGGRVAADVEASTDDVDASVIATQVSGMEGAEEIARPVADAPVPAEGPDAGAPEQEAPTAGRGTSRSARRRRARSARITHKTLGEAPEFGEGDVADTGLVSAPGGEGAEAAGAEPSGVFDTPTHPADQTSEAPEAAESARETQTDTRPGRASRHAAEPAREADELVDGAARESSEATVRDVRPGRATRLRQAVGRTRRVERIHKTAAEQPAAVDLAAADASSDAHENAATPDAASSEVANTQIADIASKQSGGVPADSPAGTQGDAQPTAGETQADVHAVDASAPASTPRRRTRTTRTRRSAKTQTAQEQAGAGSEPAAMSAPKPEGDPASEEHRSPAGTPSSESIQASASPTTSETPGASASSGVAETSTAAAITDAMAPAAESADAPTTEAADAEQKKPARSRTRSRKRSASTKSAASAPEADDSAEEPSIPAGDAAEKPKRRTRSRRTAKKVDASEAAGTEPASAE